MSQSIVSFANPPVVERVLCVQFEPLALTSGHLGWFWKSRLGDPWGSPNEAPSLPDQFETFGKHGAIDVPNIQFERRASAPPNRFRVRTVNGDRIIQLQDTRFIENWVRVGAEYPRYEAISAEFLGQLDSFADFARSERLGELKPNQWEVTYVNKVPAGPLWSEPAEWPNVIPGLLLQVGSYGHTRFEQMTGEWTSEIPDKRGRLHINAQYRARADEKALSLTLTARGPIVDGLVGGLQLGHDTIVTAFDQITSGAAHELWGKQNGN